MILAIFMEICPKVKTIKTSKNCSIKARKLAKKHKRKFTAN